MNFIETPDSAQLAALRADPLLFEQELDVRPEVARSLERALGFRAGRRYYRSASNRLYAIELADLGRGLPSMALVYAFWPRFDPRPATDEEINRDLAELCLWVAEVSEGIDPADVRQVIDLAWAAHANYGTMRLFN